MNIVTFDDNFVQMHGLLQMDTKKKAFRNWSAKWFTTIELEMHARLSVQLVLVNGVIFMIVINLNRG